MATTAVQRFYKYHAYVYDSTRWTILHGRGRAAKMLNLRGDSKVLEVGCGTGLNFRYVLEQLEPARGGRLVGLDFSEDMLERALARVDRNDWSNVELVCADATKMELGEKFDAIFFAYSLTMFPDPAASLERAREHLAPGGRVVVLDFGRFGQWGPLAPVMRTWLKLNHVQTLRPYRAQLEAVFDEVTYDNWLGGYYFTAVGERSSNGTGG